MGRVRVGLVGAGWMAREHRGVLDRIEGAELVAVCDVDRSRAEALCPGARSYADWRLLLEQERLDALVVATPPLAHRGPVVAALTAGVPTYLEKPIARTIDDAEAIIRAAEASGTVCAVGYQWHALDLVDDLRHLLRGDRIGLLLGVSIGPTESRPWFLDRRQGGGNLLERGSHHLDLLRRIGGEVASVQARASAVTLARSAGGGGGDIDDALAITAELASGALATVVIGWTRDGQPGTYALDIVAATSTLRLDLDPDFRLHGTAGAQVIDRRAGSPPLVRSMELFLQAARQGDPSGVACTPADALETLRVAAAAELALETGRTERVDHPRPGHPG